MRIEKLGHASIVVSADHTHCFMDPVFDDPFESGTNTFDPPIRIDVSSFRKRCNMVVLSHAHMDHFSPRSLAVFDRSVPVIYPEGEALIARALERLGFTQPMPVSTGTRIDTGDLRLLPTSSKVPFPELGMVFEADGRVFWNLVDTVIDDRVIASVRAQVGRPDLLFAKYQPLVENELRTNALGSDFPHERYGQLLRNVWAIDPRHVAPGSCGYRYARAEWLNDRGFPITEQQFESDLKQVAPNLRVLHVPHGGAVEVGDDVRIEVGGAAGVERLGARLLSSFDWRPERGVGPLRDQNPQGHPALLLREQVAQFLNDELLRRLGQDDTVWRERMCRLGVVWRLEVVHPDGSSEIRLLDLTRATLAWSPPDPEVFTKMHTSVTASAIVGLMRGECNSYALGFNDLRFAQRLYSVHAGGVTRDGSIDDEPLGKVLFEAAEERYLERELDLILANSSQPEEVRHAPR
jgi:hypothetical protein